VFRGSSGSSDQSGFPEQPLSWCNNIVYISARVGDESLPTEETTALFRELFGNPFRPVSVDLSWLTSTVLALAQGIYNEKAFDRMPILADALEDSGCTNTAILEHLRSAGSHVRGCWAVDLLLDKE
jgi:hypothetical protein